MKSRIFVFALSSIISSLSYCAEDRTPTELTPLSQHASPYTRKPERTELLDQTRALPTWSACCKRNPTFLENMKALTAVSKRDTHDWGLSISLQQSLYSHGCTCENPCVYVAAGTSAPATTPIAMIVGGCTKSIPISAAWPTAICTGVICIPIAICAISAAHKKCSSNNIDQLDYITDPNNLSKRPEPSSDRSYEQEPFGADWSGYDS